jgi:VWFA-related protein
MRRTVQTAGVLLLFGVALPSAFSDDQALPIPAIAVSTERVQVDFVVRDKKGSIVRNLDAADVEVYEDGVRQEVGSLHLVEAAAEPSLVLGSTSEPASPPAVVAFAFDRLGSNGRAFAQQAIVRYLDESATTRVFMGAFSVDRGLKVLQPLTADRDVLRRALESLLSTGSTSFSSLRERDLVRNAYAGFAEGPGQAHVASAELTGVPECRLSEDDVVRRLELLEGRIAESFDALERDEQGFATTHALMALVAGMQTIPGRKAVVLFSEGLVLPSGAESALRSVIAAANRANVSVYAADASGLRATSAGDETRRTIDSLQARLHVDESVSTTKRGPSAVDQPVSGLALLERNEDALAFAPESGLSRLADQTGGFLIRGTNDLSSGLREVDEDLGAYYLLSYAPKNTNYDGRFRTISLKVKRPYGRLQGRKGYLALKAALPVPLLDYEAPALARVEGGAWPTAVPLRLRGLQFPEAPPVSAVPVVVEVPARGLTFASDRKAAVYRQDFTIVALVRDAAGEIVTKMSQHYPLTGRLDHLDAARGGQVLFYRETRLPPGSYAIEAIVYDALAGAAGAARSTLEIPAAAPSHLRASSLMVVRSAERLASADAVAPRLLTYGDVLLFPNLGQPLERTVGQPLAFFVTAWPAGDRPGVEARVEFLRDGRPVVSTPATSLHADADGRIQLASSLPLQSVPPGAYELRVTLSDGEDAETRTASVPIMR